MRTKVNQFFIGSKINMAKNNEDIYLAYKKKNVINIVNRFKERFGDRVPPFPVDESTLDLEKTFCTPEVCSKCENSCCSIAPCIFSPSDFLDLYDLDYMKGILDTGLLCISHSPSPGHYENLVLRPRGLADENKIISTVYDANPCVLEGEEGCMLPALYRPCQGLLYYAYEEDEQTCHTTLYSERECGHDYDSFQKVLRVLVNEYYNVSIPYYENGMEEQVNRLVKSLANKSEKP